MAFYFALLHGAIALFGELGGFTGLSYLDFQTVNVIFVGFIAIFIMFLLAITSFDFIVKKITFQRWKLLNRLIYLAGILILVHVTLIGVNYSPISGIIPQITFLGVALLLLMESPRFDNLLKKIMYIPTFGSSFTIIAVVLGIIYFSFLNPVAASELGSFDIQQIREQEALQSDTKQNSSQNSNSITQFNVNMKTDPLNPKPDQNVTLHFSVYDSTSGNIVTFYQMLYQKPMHLIITNSNLTYFQHLLPINDVDSESYFITTQFPKADIYHIYLEFQPFGSGVQQNAFTLPVGQNSVSPIVSNTLSDIHTIKTYGNYSVSAETNGILTASSMAKGHGMISFTIKYRNSEKHLTALQSYLGAYGQLTLINENTFDIIRMQPSNDMQPTDQNNGVIVNFKPVAITGVFKPGIYRAFAEFNPDGHLFTAEYTIKIN